MERIVPVELEGALGGMIPAKKMEERLGANEKSSPGWSLCA